MTTETDRILTSDYLDDLQGRPIEDIRGMRAACVEVETGLSYLRRMVQGPLDIISREIVRRDAGAEGDRASLIGELPGILADGPRPQGVGRLPQSLEPKTLDPELSAELDEILIGGVISDAAGFGDDELAGIRLRLEQLEERVSARRRAYFGRIDALQAELTRRYRTGEASVESLLS